MTKEAEKKNFRSSEPKGPVVLWLVPGRKKAEVSQLKVPGVLGGKKKELGVYFPRRGRWDVDQRRECEAASRKRLAVPSRS